MCPRAEQGGASCPLRWPLDRTRWCAHCRREEEDFVAWLSCWAASYPWGAYPGPGHWSPTSPFPGLDLADDQPADPDAVLDAYREKLLAHQAWSYSQLMAASAN